MTTKSINRYTLVIAGGGFSGIALAYQIVQKAESPLEIYLIEKTGSFARGAAYSTPQACHLLNVRADRMGAIQGDPGHFYRWVVAEEQNWRHSDPDLANLKIDSQAFLPRKLYAKYLDALLRQSQEVAAQKGIGLHLIGAEIIAANMSADLTDGTLQLLLDNGMEITTNGLALATGVRHSREFPSSVAAPEVQLRYVSDLWDMRRNPFLGHKLPFFADGGIGQRIVIIGTGLTAVDACMSLLQHGYKGAIVALSTTGKLSEPHLSGVEQQRPPYPCFWDPEHAPVSVRELFSLFRRELVKAAAAGYDWRDVVDALRPVTVALWRRLPDDERKRFLRHLGGTWNRLRHRIPTPSYHALEALMKDRKLILLAAKVDAIDSAKDGRLAVQYHTKGSDKPDILEADWVLNCTGHEVAVGKNSGTLVRQLLHKGYVKADHLGLGLQLTPSGDLAGRGEGSIFALGMLLFGENFETIAVPELRDQAGDLAVRILGNKIL